MPSDPLYVTFPVLPDLEALEPYLKSIWSSKWVTNHGHFHAELEERLQAELKVPTALVFNNGTIGLITVLKFFDFQPGAEIITTPFTFAATAHAISWNNLVPVFVDIDEATMTLDPASVEMAITDKTCAILGVHVYGNICDVSALGRIAAKHDLKVIYDAAHAFGVELNGCGIGSFGDATVFSFHATKLFNTLEGGCVTTSNAEDAQCIYWLRNFGIKDEETVVGIGINGKMNEIQAAIGLLNLDGYKGEQKVRSNLRQKYNQAFAELEGVSTPLTQMNVTSSEQYYTIRVNACKFGASRDQIYNALVEDNIFPRKYFYPICTDFSPYRDFRIISCFEQLMVENIKTEVLCLPFHSGVQDSDVERITNIMTKLKS